MIYFGQEVHMSGLASVLEGLPDVMTIREVSKLFRLSESHLRDLVRSGELRSIQLGSKKAQRVLREDVLAFMESRRTPSVVG